VKEAKHGTYTGSSRRLYYDGGHYTAQTGKQRTATIFIATGLLGTVVGIVALFTFVFAVMLHR
jgi:hypothetical protein